MTTHDLLLMVLYAGGICVFVFGMLGIVAQVRFEWRKWRAHRDIDRLMKERNP